MFTTNKGEIIVKLYEETPLHKANFIKLVQQHFYDSTLFHRVISAFMIQAGDPLSKKAKPGDSLGHGNLGYTVPAEFNSSLYHTKGKICAARENDNINPEKASDASQFYIVIGKKRSLEELKKIEDRINTTSFNASAKLFMKSQEGKELKSLYDALKARNNNDSAATINNEINKQIELLAFKNGKFKFNPKQINDYASVGGTPHLDGAYTVFGEVVSGLEIAESISKLEKDKRDRPITDIRILKCFVK